jgi:hypothetical protein
MKDRHPYQSVGQSQRDTKNCSHPSDNFWTNAMRYGVSLNDYTRRWKGFRTLGRLGRTFALSDHSRYRRDEG